MSRRVIGRTAAVLLLAVIALLVIADRLTESAASHAVSVEARQAGLLATDPTVTIAGFPFLTQVAAGRYRELDVTTHGIHRGGLRIDTVSGRFTGVHVGLGATLDGRLGGARIDRARGSILITYADLNAFLKAERLAVTALPAAGGGTSLVIAGASTVGSARVPVSGPVVAAVSSGNVLTLTPLAGRLRDPSGPLPASAAGRIRTAYTVSVSLAELPFGLLLQQLSVGPAGLAVTASAVGPVVPVPADASVG